MADTTRSITYSKLYTDTWDNRRAGVVDQIFRKRPAYAGLYMNDRVRVVDPDGGNKITQVVNKDYNDTFQGLGRFGAVTLQTESPRTLVGYDWKRVVGHSMSAAWDELLNTGSSKQLDMIRQDIQNMEESSKRKFESYAAGNGGGSEPYGIPDLVDTDPTSSDTIGMVDQSSNAWWRNQTSTATDPFHINGERELRALKRDIEEEGGRVNYHITEKDVFGLYREGKDEIVRASVKELYDAGVENLEFDGTPLVWSPEWPSGRWDMLDLSSWEFRINRKENFKLTEPVSLDAAGQPGDKVRFLLVMCQLCCWQRRVNGVYHSISTS